MIHVWSVGPKKQIKKKKKEKLENYQNWKFHVKQFSAIHEWSLYWKYKKKTQ